jgi:Outer membrane lipoprotein-sorting protein
MQGRQFMLLNIIWHRLLVVSCVLCLICAHQLFSQDYSSSVKLTEHEAREIISKFREARPAAAYYFEFTLNQIPRKGDTVRIPGRLWAWHNERGSIWRLEINPGRPNECHYLIQNGQNPALWSYSLINKAELPHPELITKPFIPDSEVSAFDLQMPYLYWQDIQVLGLSRMRGRPAYQFLFKAPDGFNSGDTSIAAVRAYLDTQYNAPVQTEVINNTGKILKTLILGDLKKVQGQWIPRSIDMRNEVTRNKTQFEVTAAVLGIEISPAIFDPANLASSVRVPAESELTRF